eukprot:scaffold28932_cov72-Cyclotella_meneghiniana.AAC.2
MKGNADESNRVKLSMRRLLSQRDTINLLLSPPSKETTCNRCGRGLLDGDVSRLSLRELASLLGEIGAGRTLITDESNTGNLYQKSRKRPRAEIEIGNNHHAILLFIQRVLNERFSSRCDSHYLDEQLKAHFGFHDASFHAVEDIICSAFLVSLHAIRHCIRQQSSSSDDFNLNNIPDTIQSTSVIDTALGIIHFVEILSKQERALRMPLVRGTTSDGNDTKQPMSKRQRYQHLLQNYEVTVDEANQDYTKIVANTITVVEEKYPDHWEWMKCFRRKYNSKQEGIDEPESVSTTQQSIEQEVNPFSGASEIVISSSEEDNNDKSKDVEPGADKSTSCVDSIHEEAAGNSNVASEETGEKERERSADDTVQSSEKVSETTPLDELDKTAYQLRLSIMNMPPSDLSNAVGHITKSIVFLLKQYGDLDGAAGVERCGEVINGGRVIEEPDSVSGKSQFHLSDVLVSAVMKEYLTDATGALRAKAFLGSFVLPLILEMNTKNAAAQGAKDKPASRSVAALLSQLARDRPMECVESILIPVLTSCGNEGPSSEPNRFQCNLIDRILKGKDSLSLPAIALFLEKTLPSKKNTVSCGGMVWTEHSMPLVLTCLNRQPQLSNEVVALLADQVRHYLSPAVSESMEKNFRFSNIFQVLVTKYGTKLKAVDKIDHLKDAASRLKSFMSKQISTALSKL